MATVNFSIPDDVKKAFDRAFKNQNKSAVIADLMRRAVADAQLRKRRAMLFRVLTDGWGRRPATTDEEIRNARAAGRS